MKQKCQVSDKLELRDSLLSASENMSHMLSVCTNQDYVREPVVTDQFISKIASSIGELIGHISEIDQDLRDLFSADISINSNRNRQDGGLDCDR